MTSDSDAPARTLRPRALLLAWLWPGLGHLSRGERARGVRIMAGVLLLFFGGLLIGGIDVVDRREDRLWFIAQAGVGPLSLAADWANQNLLKTGRIGTLIDAPAPPAPVGSAGSRPTVSDRRSLAHANEFGTLFIALAGLMNVVIILDAGFRRQEGAE